METYKVWVQIKNKPARTYREASYITTSESWLRLYKQHEDPNPATFRQTVPFFAIPTENVEYVEIERNK